MILKINLRKVIVLRSKSFSFFDFFKKANSVSKESRVEKIYPNYSELRGKFQNLKELDKYQLDRNKYTNLAEEYLDNGGFLNGDYYPLRFIEDEDANWWGNSGLPKKYRPVLEGTDLHDMLCIDINTGKYYIVDPETSKAIPTTVNNYKKFILKEMKRPFEGESNEKRNMVKKILNKY